jgi:hypothetical protein
MQLRRLFKTVLLSLSLMLILTGCGTRAYLLGPGTTAVLKNKIVGADLYVPDENGQLVGAKGDLEAGTLVRVPKDK